MSAARRAYTDHPAPPRFEPGDSVEYYHNGNRLQPILGTIIDGNFRNGKWLYNIYIEERRTNCKSVPESFVRLHGELSHASQSGPTKPEDFGKTNEGNRDQDREKTVTPAERPSDEKEGSVETEPTAEDASVSEK